MSWISVDTPTSLTIDLDAPGKHFGYICVPHSRNEDGAGNLLVPIVSIRNGSAKTILLTAGNHGDEFEGQLAVRKLIHSIDAHDVSGHIIVLPALNLPAVKGNARLSPLDGVNMNRTFPGGHQGTITQRVAAFVNDVLIPRIDINLDLHSGGRALRTVPFTLIHDESELVDRQQFLGCLETAKAFAAPYTVLLKESDPEGLLDTAVERAGKIFVGTELGGQACVTPQSVALTERGVRNILAFHGFVKTDTTPGQPSTRVMSTPAKASVQAQDSGLFEPYFELGDWVEEGAAVGALFSISHPDRDPIVHHAKTSGMVIIRRTDVVTEHGACLYILARDIEPAAG